MPPQFTLSRAIGAISWPPVSTGIRLDEKVASTQARHYHLPRELTPEQVLRLNSIEQELLTMAYEAVKQTMTKAVLK